MNIEDLEKEIIDAGAKRLAALDNDKILAAARREMRELSDDKKRAAEIASPVRQKSADNGRPVRGGIAALNPFRYGAKGVAVFAAAILVLLGGITALTIWLVNHNAAGRAAYMIELLADTMVDMDGVTAFGIVESGGTVRNSALYADEQETKNSKFDSTLVSFDENGDVSEVVFRYVDGKGEVTQDKIGIADNVYVTTEFTFIQYSTQDDIWKGSNGNNNTPKEIYFRCDDWAQTFAIHNVSGKVYALNDIGEKYIRETMGADYEHIYTQFTVLDGAFITDIQYYDGKNAFYNTTNSFQIDVDENANLIASELMPNKNAKVKNIYRDVYGNLYVYNSLFDEVRGDILYFSPSSANKTSYYYGTDKKVYHVEYDDRDQNGSYEYHIKVYGENLELQDCSATTDVSLFEMKMNFRLSSDAQILVLKNGYLFEPTNTLDVFKQTADGSFAGLGTGTDVNFGNIEKKYLLGSELTAIVERDGVKTFVHIDLSEFDETDRKITIKEICDASHVTKPYGIFIKSLIVTKQTLDGAQRYQVSCENGKIVQTLLSDEKYGGRIISIQPLN